MKLRHRIKEEKTSAIGPEEKDDSLGQLRQTAERLVAAGDEAINKALMGDSQRFLQATRQKGGQ